MIRSLPRLLPYAWAAAAAGLLFAWFGRHGYDDPFITYRYAENIAAGLGFVYNPGERVLSTTTPLYALILAGARALGAAMPLFSNALGAASLALGGLACWELGRAWHTPVVGLACLLIYPIFPLLVTTLGSELPLYLALVLGGFLAYARRRYLAVAALLALATLVRADGVLAAGVVGVAVLADRGTENQEPRTGAAAIPHAAWLSGSRLAIIKPLMLYCAIVLPWLLFAQAYFGAPFPATLAAKQRQGLLPGSELFLPGLLGQLRDNYWRFAGFRPLLLLAALGLPAALLGRSRWLLIVGWGALYAAAYAALGVTSYFWYYAPLIPGLAALVGLGAAGLAGLAGRGASWATQRILLRRTKNQEPRTDRRSDSSGSRFSVLGSLPAWLVALALIGLALRPELRALPALRDRPDTRQAIYRRVGEWLRANTPPGARVGTLEVGMIGYYAERRMIDFAGLLQPPVAQQLTPASSYDTAAVWAFEQYRPEYLVLQDGALPTLQAQVAPAHGCRPAQTFTDPVYALPIVVLACG